MFRASPSALATIVLLCSPLATPAAETVALERGTAITDPFALRELDLMDHATSAKGRAGFGLGASVADSRASAGPILNDELFGLPAMAPVQKALDEEFERYVTRHRATRPGETIGVGPSYDWQLFDRDLLHSGRTRFVLSGIVSRMDRAYVSPETCGEVRLIYRLTRMEDAPVGEHAQPARLPMTLNLVLPAKGARAELPGGIAITCREIARRWLATADWTEHGVELANKLTSAGGPLELVAPSDALRIETNLQIAHAPKSAVRDFRTDYLLKVFDYDARSGVFAEAPLENQIDRERLLSDVKLAAEFKTWLLDPVHLGELDRGTILIPEQFLAKGAIASTPAGFANSNLQPAFGLVAGDDGSADRIFGEGDVIAALKKAAQRHLSLQNMRSLGGFEHRLNDITCAGCHQTRGIGGFHFPGVDWMAEKPSNSVVVAGSPHFFGDQIRRRDILAAFRDGRQPDFSRGFSARPQLRGSAELAGTEYEDGWGAHCYLQRTDTAENDKSFRSWTCAEGLACQVTPPATRFGMCFIKNH